MLSLADCGDQMVYSRMYQDVREQVECNVVDTIQQSSMLATLLEHPRTRRDRKSTICHEIGEHGEYFYGFQLMTIQGGCPNSHWHPAIIELVEKEKQALELYRQSCAQVPRPCGTSISQGAIDTIEQLSGTIDNIFHSKTVQK